MRIAESCLRQCTAASNSLRGRAKRVDHRFQRHAPFALEVIVTEAVKAELVFMIRFQRHRERAGAAIL